MAAEGMTAMTIRIGILGRHRSMLDAALAFAAQRGFEARATTEDDEALAWITAGEIAALSIGGGVEDASRLRLLAACAQAGVQAIEVYGMEGPRGLERALDALSHED
jgi:DNA-binding NtrC family response regulator